ncbi:MAG: hypothetical protein GY711_13610 [bacterium]|nr:hypothetical protein [bacterium]
MNFARFAPAALLTASALADEHHIVALDGSGDFSAIQLAVDAAQDGDVIHARVPADPDQWMPGFTVAGKSVSIHASGARRLNVGPVEIIGLPDDGLVALRGFELNRWDFPTGGKDDPDTPDTGLGYTRIVDRGAYER